MKKRIKQSRALLLMLVFLLAFAPLSALADTGQKKTINYVALGDSLAAGMLFDGSGSPGYAGKIKSDLEASGYNVELQNKGVNGATSAHVLDGLSGAAAELVTADVVTISVGANDILAGIDPSLLEYLTPGKLEALKQAVVVADAAAKDAKTTAETQLAAAKVPVNEARVATESVQQNVSEVKGALEAALPDSAKPMLANLIKDIDDSAESVNVATNKLDERTVEALKVAVGELNKASAKLLTVVGTINTGEGLIPEQFRPEVQAFKNLATGAVGKVNEAKVAVETAKDKVDAATKAQDTATAASELLISAPAKVKEIGLVINAIPEKIGAVGTNLAQIIGSIKAENPTAKIYVMGYYNALPYLSPEAQKLTIPLLNGLNSALKGATDYLGETFIPTFSLFEGNYPTYLPNPINIHPSESGYRALATGFMGGISTDFPGYKEPVVSNWVKEDGKWYYNDSEGNKVTGWKEVSGKWYYLDKTSGVMQTDWLKVGTKWYYLDEDGAMETGWLEDGTKWYYLDKDGVMQTDWLRVGTKWYYLDKDGAMQTDWLQVGTKWYYLDKDGAMQTDWLKVGTKWYYLEKDGAMQTGWKKVGTKWYYLENSGAMTTGWEKVGTTWYYLDGSGAMAAGWLKLGTKWYYLDNSGAMKIGAITVLGKKYTLNNSGVWVP